MSSRTQAHVQYRTKDGIIVPATTAILNAVLSKPALIDWAYRCGRQGIDYKAFRDAAGDSGTLTHYLILCDLNGTEPDTSEYSQVTINKSSVSLMKWFNWKEGKKIFPSLVEAPLISETHRYGGTIDLYGVIDGLRTLVDFKTGKAIYEEHILQVAAYHQLLLENAYPVDAVRVIRLGREDSEGFEDRSLEMLPKYFKIFSHCAAIHHLRTDGYDM